MGAQCLSGRVLDSRPRGCGFESHWRHCVVVLDRFSWSWFLSIYFDRNIYLDRSIEIEWDWIRLMIIFVRIQNSQNCKIILRQGWRGSLTLLYFKIIFNFYLCIFFILKKNVLRVSFEMPPQINRNTHSCHAWGFFSSQWHGGQPQKYPECMFFLKCKNAGVKIGNYFEI